jgi:hypothetical protein
MIAESIHIAARRWLSERLADNLDPMIVLRMPMAIPLS